MKLPHPKGALEVREVIAYEAATDTHRVRFDCEAWPNSVRSLVRLSGNTEAELRESLNNERKLFAERAAEDLARQGVPHSKTYALPMPSHALNPEWAL